jgi:cytochrome P450
MNQSVSSIPAHVPPQLVQHFAFDSQPGIDRDPPAAMDASRDSRDIVFAPQGRRGRATWVFKRYEHIVEAFQMPEVFSSDRYSGFSQLLGEDWPMLPLEVDPPVHRLYRTFLNKVFSPLQMSRLEQGIGSTVDDIVTAVLPAGSCEFQHAVARRVPTTVFLRLMGLPLEHSDRLLEWETALLHGATLQQRVAGARAIKNYLIDTLQERAQAPREDVVTYIATGEVDGRPLTADEKLGMAFVLYGAGLDTVAATLGFTFKYLAEHPQQQRELREDPSRREKAIEEFLRYASMVVSGRTVTRDIEFHGVQLKRGDYVSLPTMFANRDPQKFDAARELRLDRAEPVRHVSFGAGAHTCLGAHLARRELKIVLNAWLDRVPPFRLQPGRHAVTYGGSVFGVDSLPLAW